MQIIVGIKSALVGTATHSLACDGYDGWIIPHKVAQKVHRWLCTTIFKQCWFWGFGNVVHACPNKKSHAFTKKFRSTHSSKQQREYKGQCICQRNTLSWNSPKLQSDDTNGRKKLCWKNTHTVLAIQSPMCVANLRSIHKMPLSIVQCCNSVSKSQQWE